MTSWYWRARSRVRHERHSFDDRIRKRAGRVAAGHLHAHVKGVNHRFLDLSLRLPGGCDEMEAAMRQMVKDHIHRGHVDITLHVVRTEGSVRVELNDALLTAYLAAYREAATRHTLSAEPALDSLLRMPGVLRTEAVSLPDDPSLLRSAVLALLPELLARFNQGRAQEGAALAMELRRAMHRLAALAREVTTLREGARASYMEWLNTRMAELLGGAGIGQERVLAEAALLAERSDVDEELVRLGTHTSRFLALLDEGGELGKRLDFLLQELNREANTLLSKTSGGTGGSGLRVTELGLEMKLEIEKAREQVQNLE